MGGDQDAFFRWHTGSLLADVSVKGGELVQVRLGVVIILAGVGGVEGVGDEELVALGREHGIPVVSDLGSGCFVDLSPYGFRPEPLVRDSVRAGADVVCFSGDKLLGGPQSGIILGRADLIRTMRSRPPVTASSSP